MSNRCPIHQGMALKGGEDCPICVTTAPKASHPMAHCDIHQLAYSARECPECAREHEGYNNAADPNPLDVQVAGGHYKTKRIQPVEYIAANNLNFLEGCIVKRITRWRDKDGFQDLEKIKHEIDLLIEMEKRYG
jgi:Protein of unknwon function (DUF3310)